MVQHEAETDSGPRDRHRKERLCALTRVVKPCAEMIRFVVDPSETVIPDVKCKLPGRGVWITGTREAVELAGKRNVFARGFKREVKPPSDLGAMTERMLQQWASDALAIAYKAGLVAVGFGKVEDAIAQKPLTAVLHAEEAAPDGVRKLAGALKRRYGPDSPAIPVLSLPSEQLDLALGRPNVIHAALLGGPASGGFLARYRTLEVFRGGSLAAKFPEEAGGQPARAG